MKSKKLHYCFKAFFFLSWLVIFLFTENLFAQSTSQPTDRARVTIAQITDSYNPAGPKLKVLHTNVNTPLRAGSAWIWEKQRQEEPESYYALMKSKGLNAVRMILFDTWEVETYPPSDVFTPTDWEDPAYRTRQLARMERSVNFASKYGMYVVINSHNSIPKYNEDYVNALWKYVAPYFANRTHVLYELANEPMSGIGKNGDMDMGTPVLAVLSPRLQALKRTYDIARDGAPNTMMLILTPPGINDANFGTGMGNLADAFARLPGTTVDWTKTGVAYHLYGNDAAFGAATNAANLRNLHQRYVGWPSENSFPPGVYVYQGDQWRSQSFDNDLYVNQTCEKLGIGWAMWFINGAVQLDANFPTMWADAEAKGWAWIPDEITLPVSLLSFDAAEYNRGINLLWKTEVEINSKNFIVERKEPSGAFIEIGKLASLNNGRSVNSYEFFDGNPFIGDNYYRLKMVDLNGSFTYSKTVKISDSKKSLSILLFPNPVRNGLVNIAAGNEPVKSVTVSSVSGVRISTASFSTNLRTIQLNVGNLPKGVYVIDIISQASSTKKQLVVQ